MLQVEGCFLSFRLVSRRCHIISAIHRLLSAPLRTVLALFTHKAPHMVSSRRFILRYVVRFRFYRFYASVCITVCPHTTLTCVVSFPPAELTAFIGTTRPSDSLRLFCLPASSVVRPTSPKWKAGTGPPRLPCNHNVKHAMVSD